MLPSSPSNFQMGRSGTVGSDNVGHSQRRAGRRRKGGDLRSSKISVGGRVRVHKQMMVRTSELGITLLHIAEPLSEEFDRDIFVVHQQMPLSCRPGEVDQGVGVSREACYAADNIPLFPKKKRSVKAEGKEDRKVKKHIRIKQVNLLPTPTVSAVLRT